MTNPLEVQGLGYRLPGQGKGEMGNGRSLVRDVSFTVGAGETLVLLGRSGSGKTTTLKLINRLLQPTSGEVQVAGERAADLPVTRLRRRIGYVIQEVGLFPHFTVERNVGLVPQLEGWPPARIAARVRELLALVGLDPDTFAGRHPHELSGGQRQRVGVARAPAVVGASTAPAAPRRPGRTPRARRVCMGCRLALAAGSGGGVGTARGGGAGAGGGMGKIATLRVPLSLLRVAAGDRSRALP